MPEQKQKGQAPRKRKKRPNKREDIIKAGITVMSRYGYKESTVSMIAEKAGVSCALLIHHIGNKREMAALCAKRICAELLQEIRQINKTSADYREQADRTFALVESKQDELRLLLSLKTMQEHMIQDILPELELVTQQLMGAYGEQSQGIAHNMGALYLGYLLSGNKEMFLEARDSLLRQEQESQPVPIP